MNEILVIDPEAKTIIPLIKVPKDAVGNPYFIGKMQFPGTMEFERGASFMVFTAEDGHEELQIAPLDPMMLSKVNGNGRGASITNGKFSIDLVRFVDQNGADYYVGEAIGLSKIDLFHGIFFTIFTSIRGQEKIQISRLQVKHRQRYDNLPRSRTNTFNPVHYSERNQ